MQLRKQIEIEKVSIDSGLAKTGDDQWSGQWSWEKRVLSKKGEKRPEDLKKFGELMALVLLVIGGILLWGGKTNAKVFICIGLVFLFLGLFVPGLLGPVEKVWMKFGKVMSGITTRLILILSFYLVITPSGILLRLLKKDLLLLKLDPNIKSYWVPVEKEGPASRPFLPY